MLTTLIAAGLALTVSGAPPAKAPPLKIVTSLTTYGAIAREIVGDKATVTSSPRATRILTSCSPSPASWPSCATPTCS
jgi:hypothetical protein